MTGVRMRPLVAGLGGGIALAFVVGTASAAPHEPAKKPVATPSAKVVVQKPAKRVGAAHPPAKTKDVIGKASRKPGTDRGAADADIRESIAGQTPAPAHLRKASAPVAKAPPLDTSARRDLDAMREADGFLFPSAATKSAPLESAPSPLIAPLADEPVVTTTGLPPAPPPVSSGATDLAWLSDLTPPDLPFRWDARLVRYLDYFKNNPNGRGMVADLLKRSGRYIGEVQKRLRARGMPEDVVWLSLIESGMDPRISSRAGAAGLWQFMPKAAAAYGLRIDRWVDERLDPERSTDAALDYLSDLHSRFGRWELAFAAYNMGYGGLLTAIRKYDTNDYWDLSALEDGVPYETALYVPKILALAFVARNRAAFGVDNVDVDAPEPFIPVAKQRLLTPKAAVAKAGHPVAPSPIHDPAPAPLGSGAAPKDAIAPAPYNGPTRDVSLRWGESLESLAADHGTTESRIRAINGIVSPVPPRPGTMLHVPDGAPSAPSERFVALVPPGVVTPPEKKRIFYEVVWGDQLDDVARALGVSPGRAVRLERCRPDGAAPRQDGPPSLRAEG